MPTAEDFRTGATDIDNEVPNIAHAQSLCDAYVDDFGFTGGMSGAVRDALVASSGNAASIGTLTNALRDEMHRKARLCDQYTEEMQNYTRAHQTWSTIRESCLDAPSGLRHEFHVGWEPVAPLPPFIGAEVSRG